MALATFAQMSTRVDGGIASGDQDRAEAAIDDASALVLDLVDDATQTSWNSSTPDSIVAVVCRVALRGFLNPHGVKSERQGDYQYELDSATGIYLTDAEIRTVRKSAGKPGMASIETTHPYGFTYDLPGNRYRADALGLQ